MMWVSPGVNTNVLSLCSVHSCRYQSFQTTKTFSFVEEQQQTTRRLPAKRQKTATKHDDDWSDDEMGKSRN